MEVNVVKYIMIHKYQCNRLWKSIVFIFTKGYIQGPMKAVLYCPVTAYRMGKLLSSFYDTANVKAWLISDKSAVGACILKPSHDYLNKLYYIDF